MPVALLLLIVGVVLICAAYYLGPPPPLRSLCMFGGVSCVAIAVILLLWALLHTGGLSLAVLLV